MKLRTFLQRRYEALTRNRAARKPLQGTYQPSLEKMEERLAPVVGFNQPPPVAAGVGWDGVVSLSVTCTGSLLPTGRHILTAAHCLTDLNGQYNVNSVRVSFELPNWPVFQERLYLDVPQANFRKHPNWRGFNNSADNDIAILILPALAPSGPRGVGADRYDIYRGTDELTASDGEFSFLGYGRTGNGNTGDTVPADGGKRLGYNRFERIQGTRLQFDFDNGTTTNDLFRARYNIPNLGLGLSEAMNAPGDSGGPSFISGRIAAVTSSWWFCGCPEDLIPGINASFGDWGEYTRVSSYATWIDGIVDAPDSLVLDMEKQRVGSDGSPDTIELRPVGSYLFIYVNGELYHSVAQSRLTSVFLNGSSDRDVFLVTDSLVGKSVVVDGRGGSDEVSITDHVATPENWVFSDSVYVRQTNPVYYANVEQVTLNAGGGDLVNVRSTSAATPVTVSGAGQVYVGNGGHVENVRGAVLVRNPPSYTVLTIDNSADTTVRAVTLSSTGLTGLAPAAINWVQADLRALTIRGGNGANTYTVVNTPQSGVGGGVTTTLFCGTALDTAHVRATTGVLNISGGGSRDVVNLGDSGRVSGILGSMTISNDPSYTTVNVNDQNESAARTVTLDTVTTDAEYVRLTGLLPGVIYTRTNDTDTFNVNGGAGADLYRIRATSFRTVTRLNGGGGDDIFEFTNGMGGLASLDGGGGADALDYSAYTTGVTVNLRTGNATGTNTLTSIEYALGGSGNDILVGAGANVLGGGPGRDVLIGGAAPSVLFGDFFEDLGEDLIIAGSTIHDTNAAALTAIRDYWASGASYETRVANLMAGAGVPRLDASTVTSNGGPNLILGGGGRDFVFTRTNVDVFIDPEVNETVAPI